MKLSQYIALIDTQARLNLKANAAQTYLSYLWWLLEPLIYVAMFYLVIEVLLLRGQPGFFFFLIMGQIPFLWFAKSLTGGACCLAGKRGLMAQTKIPISIFPFTNIFESLYKQLVVFVVLFLFMLVLGGSIIDWSWLWLIPLIAVNLFFIIALTLPFTWIVAMIPDVQHTIPIVTLFFMFSSGIFFDVNDIESQFYKDILITYQPLAFIIDGYRKIVIHNQVPDIKHLIILGGVFLSIIAFWMWVFHKTQYIITSKVIHS